MQCTAKLPCAGRRLNMAVAGSKGRNMTQQAIDLVDTLSMDESIDFYNDWKVVTVFVGSLDLCAICSGMCLQACLVVVSPLLIGFCCS